MVRTQVYLAEEQHRALKEAASKASISMTELIRRIVAEHLDGRQGVAAFQKEAVLAFVGLGSSGTNDTSERHDEILREEFGGEAVR